MISELDREWWCLDIAKILHKYLLIRQLKKKECILLFIHFNNYLSINHYNWNDSKGHCHTFSQSVYVREGNGTPLQYLAWKISWMEEPCGLKSMGSLRVGHKSGSLSERLHFHFSLSCIGEGNGNSLQCSCLQNPRDGEPGGCCLWGRTESDTTEVT